MAITGAIRKVFAETPEKFDPRDYLKPAREAMKEGLRRPDGRLRPGRQRRQDQAGVDRQVRQFLRRQVGENEKPVRFL